MKRFLTLLALALILFGGLVPSTASAQSLDNSPGAVPSQGPSFAGTGQPARLSSRMTSSEAAADKAGPANDAVSSANQTYKNLATSFCLNAHYDWSVDTYWCSSQYIGEYWTVLSNSDGTRTFRNAGVGGCLASMKLLPGETVGDVFLTTCNTASPYQRWSITHDYTRGTITFQNRGSYWCLDSDTSRHTYTHVCNGGSFQKWY